MAGERAELERLRKMKRLRELEARAGATASADMQSPAPQLRADGSGRQSLGEAVRGGVGRAAGMYLFGLGDEVAGAVGAPIRVAMGTADTLGEGYRQSAEAFRGETAQFAKERPRLALAADIAGGIGGGAALAKQGGKRLAQAFTNAPIKTGIAGGGAQGALLGAGTGEGNVIDRIDDTIGGALTGAALGGGVGVAAPLVANSVSRVLAPRAAGAKAAKTDTAAFKVIKNRLAKDVGGKNEAERQLRGWVRGGSKPEELLDLGGENMRVFLREIANDNPESALAMANSFKAAQPAALRAGVRQLIDDVDPEETLNAITVAKRLQAAPRYRAAYDVEIPPEAYDRQLRELMAIPGVRAGAVRANKLIDGDVADAVRSGDRALAGRLRDTKQLLDNWRKGQEVTLDTRAIDYVTRGLRSIEKTQRRNAPDVARATGNQARAIRDELKRLNPAFDDATQLFSDGARAEDMYDLGSDIFRKNARQVGEEVANLEGFDRNMYQLGIADAVEQKIAATRDASNKAAFLNSEDIRARFRAAFAGSDDQIDEFINFVRQSENRFQRVGGIQSAAGSQTQPRQRAERLVSREIGDLVQNPFSKTVRVGSRQAEKLIRRNRQEVTDALAEILFEGRAPATAAAAQQNIRLAPAAAGGALTSGMAATGGLE